MRDMNGKVLPAQIRLVEIGINLHKPGQEVIAATERVRAWAAKYLGWKAPILGVESGYWRTEQIVVPEAGYRALLRDKENRLMALKEESKCSYFTGVLEDGFMLVSIVGWKDKVHDAGIKVLESW
jgi:hypothetical protein